MLTAEPVLRERQAQTPTGLLRSQGSRSELGSLPSVASAGAKGVFPISVTLGVYREGTGNGSFSW